MQSYSRHFYTILITDPNTKSYNRRTNNIQFHVVFSLYIYSTCGVFTTNQQTNIIHGSSNQRKQKSYKIK